MHLLRLALGACALVAAGALAIALVAGPEPRSRDAPSHAAVPAPIRAAAVNVERVRASAPPAEAGPETRVTGRASAARGATRSASQTEIELAALESEALRQIDVIPLLEAAGVDVARLRARPDADEVMRHVAADELLTRQLMRDQLASSIYPYGYPRDQAIYD
ncbi:MAG: hypothetical protein ACHQ6T_17945, partial [Myxococcota bacterium]